MWYIIDADHELTFYDADSPITDVIHIVEGPFTKFQDVLDCLMIGFTFRQTLEEYLNHYRMLQS